jgi:hypothetical protein
LFFDQFFPSVVGRAKIIDQFHADHRSPFHNTTVKNDKIKFEDPEAEALDWKVKQAYTLMIAAASEIENGVENLWKCGPSRDQHDYPDFGKYIWQHAPMVQNSKVRGATLRGSWAVYW